MTHRAKAKPKVTAEQALPPEPTFGELVEKLEHLRHIEALIHASLTYVLRLGCADNDNGGGRIVHADGYAVAPIREAVEAAGDHLVQVLDTIARQIESIEGTAHSGTRVRYSVEIGEVDTSDNSLLERLKPDIDRAIVQAVQAEFERRRAAHLKANHANDEKSH